MNFTQLQAYLKAYLETNDSAVIGQIPNFMTLALARISAELRGVVAEVRADLLPEPVQAQPAGFMGAVLLLHDGMVSTYVPPADFAGLANEQGAYYTLIAGQISVYPEPSSTTLLTLTYYQATGDNISASLPHLLLHCAAAEAELFQGNLQDAAQEIQLYQNDMSSANGWDIQSGPITLGGGLRVAQGAVSSSNTPGAGYVKGPSGAISGYIPQWDGPTGRLLNGGVPINTFASSSAIGALQSEIDAIQAELDSTQAGLGTAAAANLTTSATDTTSGRVLKVGDYGAGAAAGTALWGNANLVKQTSASDATAGSVLLVGASAAALGGDVVNETELASALALKADLASPALTGTPTAPTATVGTNTTQLATTEFVLANSSGGGVGIGQTWQDVTGSRVSGTTYTNSTGKPIHVLVGSAVNNSVGEFRVNGSIVTRAGGAGAVTVESSISVIVPNGATYSWTSSSIVQWWELR